MNNKGRGDKNVSVSWDVQNPSPGPTLNCGLHKFENKLKIATDEPLALKTKLAGGSKVVESTAVGLNPDIAGARTPEPLWTDVAIS